MDGPLDEGGASRGGGVPPLATATYLQRNRETDEIYVMPLFSGPLATPNFGNWIEAHKSE